MEYDGSKWSWIDGTSCAYSDSNLCADEHWYQYPEHILHGDCAFINDDVFMASNCSDEYVFFCNNPIYDSQIDDANDNYDIASTNWFECVLNYCGPTTYFWYFYGAIIILFIVIAVAALLHANCQRNDFFQIAALCAASMQILDMLTDVFFALDVYLEYSDMNTIQLLFIFGLSLIFIVFPILFSLYQLYSASSKYWLHQNRIRQWLLLYGKLLYFTSVITGSSFTAVSIFNSNMFGLDLFDMGLSNKYMLSFGIKRVYSIILMENIPQLLLQIWYWLLNGPNLITIVSMVLSVISIIVTIVTMTTKRRIYFTQDYVYISFDVTGQCIMDNIQICKYRINHIKEYLSRQILGVNEQSVEIQKPYAGSTVNGLRLQINISYIHDKSSIDPADDYYDKIQSGIQNELLLKAIQSAWELNELPTIQNIKCEFLKSKEQKRLSLQRKSQKIDQELKPLSVISVYQSTSNTNDDDATTPLTVAQEIYLR